MINRMKDYLNYDERTNDIPKTVIKNKIVENIV